MCMRSRAGKLTQGIMCSKNMECNSVESPQPNKRYMDVGQTTDYFVSSIISNIKHMLILWKGIQNYSLVPD